MLPVVEFILVVLVQLASANKDAAETDPAATYSLYLIGVDAEPVATLHPKVKDPSLLGVTEVTPAKVGAVVFEVTEAGNVFSAANEKYPILRLP
jgi:hypothetical protein